MARARRRIRNGRAARRAARDGELRVLDLPWLQQRVLWRRDGDDDELTVLHAADPAIVGKRFSRAGFHDHLQAAKTVRGIAMPEPS